MSNVMIDLNSFFQKQLAAWPLAKANYDNREKALYKDVYLTEHERIRLVCLPARIASSSAKITAKGEVDRPCFLCRHRLPTEQTALNYGDFHLLVNPFPVFAQHFTIPTQAHQPQALLAKSETFYRLLDDIAEDYLIFFNGALCGASAPDHLHFQMGEKGVMPLQTDGLFSKNLRLLTGDSFAEIFELQGYTRQYWFIRSKDNEAAIAALHKILQAFAQVEKVDAEAMVNVAAWREGTEKMTLVFPRAAHRPSCFFSEDEQVRMVTSPASVEMMGYYIFPREEDFHKADAEVLRQIYREVSLSPERMHAISKILAGTHSQ